MYAGLKSLLFMLACMTLLMCVLFTYQSMCIMPEIQLLHLKLDFLTLKSSEGSADLQSAMAVSLPSVGSQSPTAVFLRREPPNYQ